MGVAFQPCAFEELVSPAIQRQASRPYWRCSAGTRPYSEHPVNMPAASADTATHSSMVTAELVVAPSQGVRAKSLAGLSQLDIRNFETREAKSLQ